MDMQRAGGPPAASARRAARLLLVSLAAFAAATLVAAGGSAAGTPGGPNGPEVVAAFDPGTFPESLAVDAAGSLYVTLGFAGEVVKVAPDGSSEPVATIDVGQGLLTGLAFDADGELYVAAATFAADPAPGVFRIDPAGVAAPERVLTLPAESFPNGLAFHAGLMYVADSHGAIWRSDPAVAASPEDPWLADPLLAPLKFGLGANGIAFRQGAAYVAVSEAGRIVRIPLAGVPAVAGALEVVAERHELETADGIAFDQEGRLYVAVNRTNRLYRLDPDGSLTRILDRSDGLAYPTMPAFGTTAAGAKTLYLANGAFQNGTADVVSWTVAVAGLALPS